MQKKFAITFIQFGLRHYLFGQSYKLQHSFDRGCGGAIKQVGVVAGVSGSENRKRGESVFK